MHERLTNLVCILLFYVIYLQVAKVVCICKLTDNKHLLCGVTICSCQHLKLDIIKNCKNKITISSGRQTLVVEFGGTKVFKAKMLMGSNADSELKRTSSNSLVFPGEALKCYNYNQTTKLII